MIKRIDLFLLLSFISLGISQPVVIRVMTYNIHHGEGTDQKLDLNRIAKVINEGAPDLVALQEVDKEIDRSNGMDEAHILGTLTGMVSVFGKNIDYSGGEYGNAILSRYPIIKSENRKLPNLNNGEQRGLLAVWIENLVGGDKDLVFLCTHFDHRKDPEERLQSMEQIKQWIQEGDFGENIILAGDLNDVPGSELILTCSSFCDNSTNDDQYETFYSVNPDRQLDYIFSCPKENLSFKNSRVIDEPIASDHRPLISDIIVP